MKLHWFRSFAIFFTPSCPLSVARSAMPAAPVNACVFATVLMPFWALCLCPKRSRYVFSGIASFEVFRPCYRLKVGRIDAAPIPTQVVNIETVRYLANKQDVCHAVGIRCLSMQPRPPISIGLSAACPIPAPGLRINSYLRGYPIRKRVRGEAGMRHGFTHTFTTTDTAARCRAACCYLLRLLMTVSASTVTPG